MLASTSLRVHVRRRAGAALIPVDLELIVVLAVEDRLAGLLDHRQPFRLHRADFRVGARRGQLDDRPGLDEAGIVVDRDTGELEVLQAARGLHAVVGVRRDLLLAQQVALDAHARRAGFGGRARGGRGVGRAGPKERQATTVALIRRLCFRNLCIGPPSVGCGVCGARLQSPVCTSCRQKSSAAPMGKPG